MQKNRGYVWLTTLLIVLIIVLIIAGFGAGWLLRGKAAAPKDISPSPKACTMEAKLCPDGSYVGRTGPNCEFAKCPGEGNGGAMGTVTGQVRIGPLCPVEPCPG